MELSFHHCMDFREILYPNIFLKSVEKIQVSLKSDKNSRDFGEDLRAVTVSLRILLKMRSASGKVAEEIKEHFYVQNIFRKSYSSWDVEKYCRAEQATHDNTVYELCMLDT